MLILILAIGAAIIAHVAPFPFLLDATDKTVWRMPRTRRPDGLSHVRRRPESVCHAQLLDVLARHGVTATFFVIDKHITARPFPSSAGPSRKGTRWRFTGTRASSMFKRPTYVASAIQEAAARLELLTGHPACRAFRPHAGHRSIPMIMGAAKAGYLVVGWSWMLWDFNWFRRRTPTISCRAWPAMPHPETSSSSTTGTTRIPGADRRYAVETVDRLIPELRARGFAVRYHLSLSVRTLPLNFRHWRRRHPNQARNPGSGIG